MALFGRKKQQPKTQQPPGLNPFAPVAPHPTAPGQMSAQRGTLAQNLGLDSQVSRLPPLPGAPQKDAALGKSIDLPPLPPSSLSAPDDLPPLPRELPPLNQPSLKKIIVPKRAPAKPAEPERAPVFIRLDKYQDIIDTVNQMESRINNLQNAIKKIGDIKAKEKDIIDSWSSILEEAKHKVDSVNSRLPEAK